MQELGFNSSQLTVRLGLRFLPVSREVMAWRAECLCYHGLALGVFRNFAKLHSVLFREQPLIDFKKLGLHE